MKTIDKKIHVAMASDDNYAHHLAVAICSILKNLGDDRILCVYLLHEKLSNKTKEKIELLKKLRHFELEYINISCEKYEPFKIIVGLYISRLTYARFQLPSLLKNIEKCIYLDCDIIVRQDLSELWDIQLPEHAILGAVEEPGARHRNRVLDIPDSFSYFNAGVILLDLAKLRKINFEEKAYEYLKKNGSLLYADQDVMNALFCNSWYALPIKWNVHTNVYILKSVNKYYKYQAHEVENVFGNAAIVHFSHERKPDSLISQCAYRNEYWQYMKYTAWRHTLPKEINLMNLTIRIYWLIKSLVKKSPILFVGMRMVKRAITGYYLNKETTRYKFF